MWRLCHNKNVLATKSCDNRANTLQAGAKKPPRGRLVSGAGRYRLVGEAERARTAAQVDGRVYSSSNESRDHCQIGSSSTFST